MKAKMNTLEIWLLDIINLRDDNSSVCVFAMHKTCSQCAIDFTLVSQEQSLRDRLELPELL